MYTEYLGPISNSSPSIYEKQLEKAARLLQQGGLVAFPTETVYGLGANILDERALQRVYDVKGRASTKSLPILLGHIGQVQFVAHDIPEQFFALAKAFSQDPLTIILKKKTSLNRVITGDKDSVALRLSSHPVAKRLSQLTGCPLALTSANLSGKPSATKASHVLEDFNGKIEAILDGGSTEFGLESTIISLENPKTPTILRQGALTKARIENVLEMPALLHTSALPINRGLTNQPAVRLFSSENEMQVYLKLSATSKRLIMSMVPLELKEAKCEFFKLLPSNLYDGLRHGARNSFAEILVLCNDVLKANRSLLSRVKEIAST